MKKLTLILMFFLLRTIVTSGQTNSDFAYINYSTIPKTDFDKRGGSAALKNLEVNLITPTLKPSEKLKINNIINYRYCAYTYSNSINHLISLPETLQEIRYTVLLRYQLTSRWGLLAIPRISIRSDFETSLSNNDLFPSFTATAIHTSEKQAALKWGLGINYNNTFLYLAGLLNGQE